eukprot:8819130-Alexandrium_andersonii.AAC.1
MPSLDVTSSCPLWLCCLTSEGCGLMRGRATMYTCPCSSRCVSLRNVRVVSCWSQIRVPSLRARP